MTTLRDIFFTFVKVGAFTFGGGYAMLPIIQKEVVARGWITDREVADYYALSQCLPGMIAVNTAAFIGHKVRGKAGGVAACLGVVTPSFLIITIIAAFINNALEFVPVQRALFGISAVVCALIAHAVIRLWKTAVKDVFGLCVYALTLILALFFNLPIAGLLVGALSLGIAADLYRGKGGGAR
ncbi:MAG: chromate transporter [Oscillospiraceae bacterium]|nr:chromate transporter [Oscillospiraceae bacterium]